VKRKGGTALSPDNGLGRPPEQDLDPWSRNNSDVG